MSSLPESEPVLSGIRASPPPLLLMMHFQLQFGRSTDDRFRSHFRCAFVVIVVCAHLSVLYLFSCRPILLSLIRLLFLSVPFVLACSLPQPAVTAGTEKLVSLASDSKESNCIQLSFLNRIPTSFVLSLFNASPLRHFFRLVLSLRRRRLLLVSVFTSSPDQIIPARWSARNFAAGLVQGRGTHQTP
jgi:hypothetical protein